MVRSGFDFDHTMLRIGSMNMLLHGVENPDISYRDSLAEDHADEDGKYTLVLANPPFAGSLDYENTAKNLLQVVKIKMTELLFLALFLRLLKPGGRAPVYDVDADGWSLDDRRLPFLAEERLGPVPKEQLTIAELEKNNLPDILSRWVYRERTERERPRTARSFCVPKSEVEKLGYDLSLGRYKAVEYETVQLSSPQEILEELAALELEIQRGIRKLEAVQRGLFV